MRLSSYGPQLGSKRELPRGESASYKGQGADAPSRRVFLQAPREQAAATPTSQVRGAAWRGWPSKLGGIPSWHTVSRCRTRTEDERILTISAAVGHGSTARDVATQLRREATRARAKLRRPTSTRRRGRDTSPAADIAVLEVRAQCRVSL